MVVRERPIKTLGLFDVRIALHPEVAVTVQVNVARSPEEAELQKEGVDVMAEMFEKNETGFPRTIIPTPSPVKSRPLFSKQAPNKPAPFRASPENRSLQDGRVFFFLVFPHPSPGRDSNGFTSPHPVP